MKIQTEELKAAYRLLNNVPQVDILETSRFLRCNTTERSMEIQLAGILIGFATVKVKDGTKLKFHLDRSALGGFLAAAHGEEITLQTGDKIQLQQGRNKLEVAKPAEVAGYGQRPSSKGKVLEFDPETFARLQTLAKYIPKKGNDERYSALQGVRGLGWMATDGLTMAVWKCPVGSSIAIPGVLWQAMKDGDEFSLNEGIAMCTNPSGVLYQPLHADLTAFPVEKTKTIAERAFQAKAIVQMTMEDWLNALHYFQGFPNEGAFVECDAGKSQLTLKVSTPNIKAETTVPAKIQGSLPNKLSWELAKLLPWAEDIDAETVYLAVMEKLAVFTTEGKKDLLAMVAVSSNASSND